ncbi:hypothetical protein Aasi_1632 [Candidatus Amoebophilus asiaticus 5a2]|uniref:Uncharacterized protein n=2 Tax=Candidatus Amoebophilus asiaticus TaxID=281120 RepID=C3L4M7_AMOA5|nr:hypothetical protein Aasi_1632 [Candidatus Amoebophilus asiaticus 5a2]
MLFIISVAACDEGCSKEPIPQAYGDLVMSVDKKTLTGETQKEFNLSFLKEDEKLRTLLKDFELKVSVEQGKVSYLAYKDEKWEKETSANFTKNLSHFFNFSELGVEEAINEKGEVKFTIKPDASRVQTIVIIELFKVDGEKRTSKGSPLQVTWNKAESEIGICFGAFYGLTNNKEFHNDQQVSFFINNVGKDEISLEDIFIRLTSTVVEHQGASFTLNGKKIINGESANIEPFLMNKNASPYSTILQLDEEGDNSASEVTLELVCGAKKIVKSLTWSKAILQPQPQSAAVTEEEAEAQRLEKEKVRRQAAERLRQEEASERLAQEEERLRQEAERAAGEERIRQEEGRLQQAAERLRQEEGRLQQAAERLRQEEGRLQQAAERLKQKEEKLKQAEEAERLRQVEEERLKQAEEQAERLARAAEAGPSEEENTKESEISGDNASTSTSTSNSSIQLASSASVVPPAPTPPPASLVSTFPTQQKPASAGGSRPIAREDKGKERLNSQDEPIGEQLLSQAIKDLKRTNEQRQSQQVSGKVLSPHSPTSEEIAREKRRSVMVGEEGEKKDAKDKDEDERDNEIMDEVSRAKVQEDKLLQEDKQRDREFRESKRSTAKRVVIPRGQPSEMSKTALLDAIRNRADQTTNVNREEEKLLRKIHDDIDKGLFKPRFTLLPSLPSGSESLNDMQKVFAAAFDRMKALGQISSDENENAEKSNDEIDDPWDDEETTTEKELADWHLIDSAKKPSLNPDFKAKLKRLREIYRRAISGLDPDRNWGWGKWLVWEYQHYNTSEKKANIEATVDIYIEEHADELQGEFANLDISNPTRVDEERKIVVKDGDINRTLMLNE